jgi:hypothetical protein
MLLDGYSRDFSVISPCERVIRQCDIATVESERYRLREATIDATRRAAGSRKSVS